MPRRCALGCPRSTRGLLHIFPNPEKYPEQHREWVKIVNGRYDPDYDYRKYRICDRHFTMKDRTRSSRLNVLAIPSLYLTGMPEHAAKFIQERETKLKVMNTSSFTSADNSFTYRDLSDTSCPSPENEITFEQPSSSIQIIAGVSGKIITKRVSSVIAPQLKLSAGDILTDIEVNDSNFQEDSIDNISTIDNDEDMEEDFLNSPEVIDNKEIIKRNQVKHESLISPTPVDDEVMEQDSSRAIIARVYNYLQTEYDYMKALVGDICDVSPLADILKRTAEATGVTEDTITQIVEESQSVEQHFNLDHITNTQQSFKEESYITQAEDIKSETDPTSETGKRFQFIDLRTGKPKKISKATAAKVQAIRKKSALPVVKLIKPELLIRSSHSENGQRTTNSDSLKNVPHCQWCVLRQQGFKNNMWICELCKVSLGVNQSYRNNQTVS